MTTRDQVQVYLDFALRQLVAESYLQRLPSEDDPARPGEIIRRLKFGFNDSDHLYIRARAGDEGPNGGSNAPMLPGANRMPDLLARQFVNDYEVIDQFANNQVGFSATLLRKRGTEDYTLSFKSVEYPNWNQGGDWERDGISGAGGEIGNLGFAIGQLAAMEEYYRSLKAPGGRLAGVGQINVSGYSLGGHLATVFTLLHASDVKDNGTVTFNGAGHGNLRGAAPTGALVAQMLAEFTRILRNPGSVEIAQLAAEKSAAVDRWASDPTWAPFASENGDLINRRSAYSDPRYTFARDAIGFLFAPSSLAPGSEFLNSATPMPEAPYTTKITQLFGLATHDDYTIVANSQRHSANRVRIFIEDQPDLSGAPIFLDQGTFGSTHNMALIVDTLSLVQLFQAITPSLSLEDVQGILAAGSNLRGQGAPLVGKGRAEADSLEKALDALRKLLADGQGVTNLASTDFDPTPRGFGNYTHRNQFHLHIQQAKDWLTAIGGTLKLESLVQPLANNVTTGAVPSPTKTAEELLALAKGGDIAYSYALQALNPFVVKGDALYRPFQLGGAREGELDVFDPANGKGQLTERYLTDRAAFLHSKLLVDLNNFNNDLTKPVNRSVDVDPNGLLAGFADTIFEDRTTDYRIDRHDRTQAQNLLFTKRVIFGGNASESLEGENEADSLYGGNGDDQLLGRAGKDYLEGGRGLDYLNGGAGDDTLLGGKDVDSLVGGGGEDTYRVRKGDGVDYVIDFTGDGFGGDGTGKIELLGIDLTGLKTPVNPGKDDGLYQDANGFRYAFTAVPGGSGILTITKPGETDGVVVLGFARGQLGIALVQQTFDKTVVLGTPDTDRLAAGAEPNQQVIAAGGNDLLTTRGGYNEFYGGPGRDVLLPFAYAVATSLDPDRLYGEADNDVLQGGLGADVLDGGTGHDVVDGGEGADAIAGGEGNDFLVGGGSLLPDLPGLTLVSSATLAILLQRPFGAYVVGDARPGLEAMMGSLSVVGDEADVIDGGPGNDTIIASGGDDLALGGDGEDLIDGDEGNDTLHGGDHDDSLWGDGTEGMLTFNGPGTSISAYVSPQFHGNDTLLGGSGDDELVGDGGADQLYGGEDRDRLFGDHPSLAAQYHGEDHLDGGEGDDLLWGHGKNDTLYGGDGDDALQGDSADTPVAAHGADYLDGGAGVDRLTGDGGADLLYGGTGDDFLFGDADDLPTSDDGADLLDGEDGNDYLRGHGGDDVLFGGAGDDQLVGDGDGSRAGETGADLLIGGTGNDRMDGGEGDDTYELNPGDGTDRIFDAAGTNTVVFGAGISASAITVLQGTDGAGTYLVLGYGAGDQVGVQNGFTGGIQLYRFADGTVLTPEELARRLGRAQLVPVAGGPGDDALASSGFLEVLSGDAGNDTYLFAGSIGRDLVSESGGVDTLRFDASVAASEVRYARASNGDLVVSGPRGIEVRVEGHYLLPERRVEAIEFQDGTIVDTATLDDLPIAPIAGSSGDDQLTGSPLADTLVGGAGRDTLSGGSEGDTYVLFSGDGEDTITDADALAGTGTDTGASDRLLLKGFTREGLWLERGVEGTLTIYGLAAGDRITLPDFYAASNRIEAIDLFADAAAEAPDDTIAFAELEALATVPVYGGDAGETLAGSSASDTLSGEGGDDVVAGLAGDDVLTGGAGDDTLDAGAGDDVLDGGLGNDTLTGGEGDDVYLFGYGEGQDTLADGASGDSDALALFAGAGPADVELERLANDLIVKLRNALDQVTVRDQFAGDGIDRVEFADGSFWDRIEIAARVPNRLTEGPDTYTGSAYADTIYGRGGADRLFGQAGGDLVDGGDGADELYGGDGDDRLLGEADGDWISAGKGADSLEGGAGGDVLYGEEDDDVLSGGPGDDTLAGGAGSDTYRFAPGEGRDTIDNYDSSGTRVDVLAFWASDSTEVRLRRAWSVDSGTDELYFDLLDPAGLPTGEWVKLVAPFLAADSVRMLDRVEFADGVRWTDAEIRSRLTTATSSADTFRGFGGADSFDGGAGDDYIAGAASGDTIFGGEGADRLWGEIGDDVLDGGAGDDALFGDYTYPSSYLYEGRDILRGGDGADSLDAGGGADSLEGGAGADRLLGGEGDDLYLYARGDGADEITDRPFYSNGTGGNDVLRFATGIAPADLALYRTKSKDFFAPGDDLTLVLDRAGDQIRIASYFALGREVETIEFGEGTRWGRAEVEARLRTGAANTATGTAGDDTFLVDNEWDVVVEQSGGGTDTIESLVSYLLPANVEHLTITGALDAAATGNDLDNTLRGNANANRLEGGRGMDTLIGGRGDDVYVDEDPSIDGYLSTYTPDAIVELASEGTDTVEAKAYDYTLPDNVERLVLLLTPEYSFYDSRVGRYVAVPRHGFGNSLDNLLDASRAQRDSPVILDGGAGADAYIGHWGQDTYRLADPGDRILATGDTTLYDTYLHDAVESAFDFDLAGFGLTLALIGDAPVYGRGNDAANTLDGSQNAAANLLIGGRGDDRYVFGAGDLAIEEAGEGRDTVQIASGPAGEYRLGDHPNVEAIELGELLYASSLVGTAGDDFLTGNRFANRLDGGAGADALSGGDGSDTYVTGRALGRRHEVARIDEDRLVEDDSQWQYFPTRDTVVLAGLQDDLETPLRVDNDLVLEQVRRDPADPTNDLLFESVRVVNYFGGARYRVETVQFGDGTALDLGRMATAGVRVPGSATTSTALWGYVGADELVATDAATSLYGGYGDDVLRGGAAGDTIAGEAGNDRMLGGAGDDRYTFSSGFGRDYVEDAGGDDSLEFAGFSSTGLTVRASGDRLELAFASGEAVVVRQETGQGPGEGAGIERAYFSGDNVWLDAAALAARAVGPVANLAPFVNAPPRDRAVLEDEPVSLALGTDAFVDVDPGDALTYSLAGSFGASLPAWLSLDAQTLTLSGTPGNGDVGATWVDLAATDRSGATATWTIELAVTNVNDAPLATPPGAQTAFAGQSYVLALVPEVFSDPDAGDYLGIDATLAGGDPLPDWLLLDDGALWGNPTATDLGRYVIELVATDAAGATATASVTLDVLRENHAPTVAAPIPNQTANEDAAWTYVVAASAFTDQDAGDTLAYSAMLAGGGALPAWLAFDPDTRRFSGTPGNESVGTVSIAVSATDTAGASASDAFDLKVTNVNDAPQLLRSSDATGVEEGQALAYLANAAFLEIDAGDALTYSAKLGNGSALPAWLTINATSGRLSGTPAIGAIGTLDVRITAKDKAGAAATLPMLVTVAAAPPQNLVGTSSNNTLTGKSGDDRLDGKAGADTLRGGLGNDTYLVDNTGDSVVENAAAGSDLVESSITYSVSSRPNVEHVALTGTAAINATGNSGNNMLRGNAANNTLSSNGGVDALQGLGGNDTLTDSGGNGLLDGGSGTDTLTGNSARQLFIGGKGNDTIATNTGADIIAFNKGDGQDTVNASTGTDNIVSLGGGISYGELFLSKSGNHLVFETGGTDRITFRDWYASSSNRNVATLQVIAEAMAGYPSASDPLLGAKVERFDFLQLVQAFDAARAANATLARWQMMDKLLTAHLAASDTEALGGDLAYQYGLNGSVAGIGVDAAAAIVSASQFAIAPQALQTLGSLQQGTHRLA